MTVRTRWRRSAAHAAGAWALAIAYPILDVLSRAPEFFVAHRADGWDLVTLAAAVVCGGALVLALLLGAAALVGSRTLDVATALAIGLLLAAYGAQVGYRAGVEGWPATIAIGAACTVAGAVAWWRWQAVRSMLDVLALAALVVPAVFLGSREIRSLLWVRTTVPAPRLPSQAPPVVVMVFDELPLLSLLDGSGRLDSVRYPNVAALAADGIWFRNATAVSDFTRWALPAIVAGRYPRAEAVPSAAAHPVNLFTVLAPTHRLEVFEPLTALCPAELCREAVPPRSTRLRRMLADVQVVSMLAFLPPAARTGLPDVTQGWSGFAAASGTGDQRNRWRRGEKKDHYAIARSFIDGIDRSDEQPTLYFLHTIVSHHPPHLLPSGQRMTNYVEPPGMTPKLAWVETEWPVRQYHQGALVQAGLVDTILGRLLAQLRAAGMYDRALVVITADHGISFAPGTPVRNFSDAGAVGTMPVPLILKLPAGDARRAPGTVEDRNVETIDILPTIADVLGIDLPSTVDGASMLASSPARRTKRLYHDDARQLRTFGADQLVHRLDRAAAEQASVFGSEKWPVPAPTPGLAALVGRPLSALTVDVVRSAPRVQIEDDEAFASVDPSAPALPVQVKGRVVGVSREAVDSVFIAIALNGTIVATTRTWTRDGTWMALIPPERLQRGPNELEAFTVDPDRPARLVTTQVRRELPAALDLLAPEAGKFGVAYQGMYRREQARDTAFRWTSGDATIRVPIAEGTRPTTLDVGVLFSGRGGKRLRILVDGCEALSETLPAGRWDRHVALDRCALSGRWATLNILSDTHRAAGDRRRLGVALTRLVLRE
jgi:hypothetical protein